MTKGTVLRIQGLDGIRALAVLAVIAAHTHVFWLHGGGVGVDMFFVLSGFLITSLLLHEWSRCGRLSLPKFWGRRLLRLGPALVALLVCVDGFALLFQAHVGPGWQQAVQATPSIVLYFSNWVIVAGGTLGFLGPLWSLSVEEQFYLLWPVVVIVLLSSRARLRPLAIVAAALCSLALIDRILTFDSQNLTRTFGTDFRMDALLVGCLLAIAIHAGHKHLVERFSRVGVAPAIVYLLFVALLMPDFEISAGTIQAELYYTVGLTLVGIATVCVLGFVVTHQNGRLTSFLSIWPLAWTGRISYAMYLWHFPIIAAVRGAIHPSPGVLLPLALIGTYAAATLSWVLIERPISTRFHDRLVVAPNALTNVS
jgi:peptidoglycan/LPS O-acetylase OafA/YrhL